MTLLASCTLGVWPAGTAVYQSGSGPLRGRIAQVTTDDRPCGAGALNRALLDGDADCGQLCEHVGNVVLNDEAEVGATRVGCSAFGSNSFPAWWRFILLVPKVSAVRPEPKVTASMPRTRV
jgi:hypothetical protein